MGTGPPWTKAAPGTDFLDQHGSAGGVYRVQGVALAHRKHVGYIVPGTAEPLRPGIAGTGHEDEALSRRKQGALPQDDPG